MSSVGGLAATGCAVVGGGPAGMVLGLLLARSGVDVTVFEKHPDFLRDFRGDTIHPTTLGLLDDLGLFTAFDALPHSRVRQVTLPRPDGRSTVLADFGRLRSMRHPYIAMVPQWDLLDLLAEAGRAEPRFTLRTSTPVTGVLRTGGRVAGVRYEGPDGPGELTADLTVACDGRWSTVRTAAGLPLREFPVGFDVWWLRIPTPGDEPLAETLLPRTAPGRAVIAIPRRGYLQAAYLIDKGSDAVHRAAGPAALRRDLTALLPEAAAGIASLTSLDEVKLLDVRLSRLRRWYADGLLCLGDAAHAMSPVGGVGINVAVQDAVAAARMLAPALRAGSVPTSALAAVQRRRRLPAVLIQTVQRLLHRQVIRPVLRGGSADPPSRLLDLLDRFPRLSVIPAYVVGVGFRPERPPAHR